MTQENKIQAALNMIDGYDWYWRMADDWRYDRAKVGMRKFVELVSTIENSNIRTALRNLWTLKFEETRGFKNTDITAKRNEYMAVLAA